jgi:predicted DNA binding protein
MWIAEIKLKHDCVLGNRCAEFGVSLQSLDLNEEAKGSVLKTSSIHQMKGEMKDVRKFVEDLKKDKRVTYLEFSGKTLFLIEKAKKKPVSFFNRRMFFVKPVVIDNEGYEYWEIASHKKEELIRFIGKVEPLVDVFELIGIKQIQLENIYFPKVMPKLTDKQQKALELAIEKGYYQIPKGINLRALAKLMKISLATYQVHLQKAESKIIPDTISFLK